MRKFRTQLGAVLNYGESFAVLLGNEHKLEPNVWYSLKLIKKKNNNLSYLINRNNPGVGSILDTVAKDTEDTSNFHLNLYLRYIFGQPVSYQYL